MWAAIRVQWDYFTLALLLGFYVTALAVIALILTLPVIF
jgi:hypothetical protein